MGGCNVIHLKQNQHSMGHKQSNNRNKKKKKKYCRSLKHSFQTHDMLHNALNRGGGTERILHQNTIFSLKVIYLEMPVGGVGGF